MQSRNAPTPDQVDWDSLTPDSRWALRHVAQPLVDGDTVIQVAEETGLTRKEVTVALERLKAELTSQTSTTLNSVAAVVSYLRPLSLTLEATDLEAARWNAAARKRHLSIEAWLHDVANAAAA